MNYWLETVGSVVVALCGVYLGCFFSRLKKPWWLIGSSLSGLILVLIIASRMRNSDALTPFLSRLFWGRNQFVFLSLAVTIGLITPLSRLPYRFEKVIVWFVMSSVVIWFTILPFLAPAFLRNRLSQMGTVITSDGICRQSYSYSCGPAAAVTALRQLGFRASEGEIAALAYTSPLTGTLPTCLYSAIAKRYRPLGLKCSYRFFDSISELNDAGLTLAVINTGFLNDHCVTVLDVSDTDVIIADPAVGKISMSHAQFEKIWRFSGIVLAREAEQKI